MTTVNSKADCDLFENNLKPSTRSKYCGLHSSGMLLQYGSVWPHTAQQITVLCFECLSPDIIPCDYYVFESSRRHYIGRSSVWRNRLIILFRNEGLWTKLHLTANCTTLQNTGMSRNMLAVVQDSHHKGKTDHFQWSHSGWQDGWT